MSASHRYWRGVPPLAPAAFAAVVAAALLVRGASADVTLTPVAIPGQPGPDGHEYGAVFDGPRVSGGGRVIFGFAYNDESGQGYAGWQDGLPTLLVGTGQVAPGLPPTIPPLPYFKSFERSFETAVQGDDGSFIFFANLAGTDINSSNDTGLWAAGPDGQVQLVAWEGDQAAGLPDGIRYTLLTDSVPAINDHGTAAFWAAGLDPSTGDLTRGIWSWRDGETHKVAAVGDPAPGTGEAFVLFANPRVDAAGRILFAGRSNHKNYENGVWIRSDEGVEALALRGEPIPDGTAFFEVFGIAPQINSLGHMLEEITLTGPGVVNPFDVGVYRISDGSTVQIARGGDPAPGFDPGVMMVYPNAVGINDAGVCLIQAEASDLQAFHRSGIWIGDGGGLTVVAREGDPAPGADEGWVFAEFSVNFTGLPARVDASGRAFFGGTITKDGEKRYGVWVWDPSSGLGPVVAPGDTIEVAPGDVRVVYNCLLSPLDWNRGSSSVNDSGQVALDVVLENGGWAAILAELDAPVCVPDCDGSAFLNLFDFLCFVNAFNANDPYGDCTSDGVFDLFDFLCFVNAFNSGC